jgi:DNA-binding PadR family transcriptional regulator
VARDTALGHRVILRLAYYGIRTKVGGMARGSRPARKLGRRNDPGVLIMTSLASGAKHGYALARDIERFAGVKLGPGTLYGAITALEEHGLIEPAGHDERRRPYRLTAAGRAELTTAVRSLGAIAAEGARRLGISLHAPNAGWAQ